MSKYFDVYEKLETLIDEGPEPGKLNEFMVRLKAIVVNLSREVDTLTAEEIEAEYDDEGGEDFDEEETIDI